MLSDKKVNTIVDTGDMAIRLLKKIKDENSYTLSELSCKLGFQITTIELWLRTSRINKVYAEVVIQRLNSLL